MRIQISSGQGPEECELAVGLFYQALRREVEGIQMISGVKGRRGGFSSVVLEAEADLSGLEGSVLWVCKSPLRPEHKRKNWYIDVSIMEEVPRTSKEMQVRFETFRRKGRPECQQGGDRRAGSAYSYRHRGGVHGSQEPAHE